MTSRAPLCRLLILMAFALSACYSGSVEAPSTSTPSVNTSTQETPLLVSPTIQDATSTASPSLSLTSIAKSSPYPTPALTPTLSCDPNWGIVKIPTDIDLDTTLHPSKVRSNIGRVIPPLPDDVVEVYLWNLPYGEVPSSWPAYTIFLMRQKGALMLWLGLPFYKPDCCGKPSYIIYDAIPLPPLDADEVLIPFHCSRDHKNDPYLIGVVAKPLYELTTDVRHAWRINPETTTLDTVSTRGMECGCFWP